MDIVWIVVCNSTTWKRNY